MKRRYLKVLLGSFFSLFFLFFLFSPRNNKGQERFLNSASESALTTPQEASFDHGTFPELDAEAHEIRLALDQKERSIGLKRTPLAFENGKALLNLEILTTPSCNPGDADAIEMHLKAAPSQKLLISVQTASQQTIDFWDVPLAFLKGAKLTHQFTLPVEDIPKSYGLFLCTAPLEENHCNQAPLRDLNEVFTMHLRKDPGLSEQRVQIFFQYFFVDEIGLAAFSGFPKPHKFASLKRYLQERDVTGVEAGRFIDESQQQMTTLLSFPFVFDNKTVRVQLPQYDARTCGEVF